MSLVKLQPFIHELSGKMGDGLARVLSKQDFNPDAFVNKQTQGSIDDLESLRQQIAQLHSETSDGLKKNVYKHYHQFIETSKEISILEGDMYQLSHLLTDQKSIMTAMMELSVTGNKVDTPDEPDKALPDDELQKNLAFLLDRVEGCSGVMEVPGRFLVHSGDLVEIDAESLGTVQKVSIFLLNDSLMIAQLMPHRRGPVRYRFQTLYELDNLAVVNVKDTSTVRNAFKLLMFPDTRLFQAESPKAKRQWLVILEETKRKKMALDSQRKDTALLHDMTSDAGFASDVLSATDSLTSMPRSTSSYLGVGVDGSELLHVSWVQELPEDLDVCIAQRDFEGAVDLVQKVNKYLEGCPKNSTVREYKSRVEHRVQQLTAVLVHELQVSPERSIKGGPRSARRAVAQLIRLGKSVQACELFLCNRSAMCRYSLRQLKAESNAALYVTGMCRMFFTSLNDTANEFLRAFPKHLGCFSAFVLWAKQELQYFVGVFTAQVFVTKYNLSTVAECVTEAHNYCQKLSDIGVELRFLLDGLLMADLNKLIQQAGDNQMEAIRHRAVDDNWRPVNYQNEDSMRKFEAEMRQFGFDSINQYTYDSTMTYLTANTIQFTRSFMSFCGDLLKVYTPDRQHLITSAFIDILTAHVNTMQKAISTNKFQQEMPFIGHNARFIGSCLIPVVKKNYYDRTGVKLLGVDDLQATLQAVQSRTLNTKL